MQHTYWNTHVSTDKSGDPTSHQRGQSIISKAKVYLSEGITKLNGLCALRVRRT
jgi:hypothetical protein